jgi:hypothetical protein
MAVSCHHCGAAWGGDPKIGREAVCRQCGSSLHCCLNCRFYDRAKHNQCAEPAAEWVRDKSVANFCEYFEWRTAQAGGEADKRKSLDDEIKRLFKD